MGSRTISLEQSAYDLLFRAKQEGESFSMVVHRVLGTSQDPLARLSGILTPAKGAAMREVLDAERAADRQSTRERYRRLGLL